jgi:hypothetical protein
MSRRTTLVERAVGTDSAAKYRAGMASATVATGRLRGAGWAARDQGDQHLRVARACCGYRVMLSGRGSYVMQRRRTFRISNLGVRGLFPAGRHDVDPVVALRHMFQAWQRRFLPGKQPGDLGSGLAARAGPVNYLGPLGPGLGLVIVAPTYMVAVIGERAERCDRDSPRQPPGIIVRNGCRGGYLHGPGTQMATPICINSARRCDRASGVIQRISPGGIGFRRP